MMKITRRKTGLVAILALLCTLCLALVAGCAREANTTPANSGSDAEGVVEGNSSLINSESLAQGDNSSADEAIGVALEDPIADEPTTIQYSWSELSEISAEISAAGEARLAELDDSYNEADKVSEAIAAGSEVAEKYGLWWDDGDPEYKSKKTVWIDDNRAATVQIVGFNQDEKADGSGRAGITFQFVDCVDTQQMNSSDTAAGGWESSQMRSWLNNAFLSSLPSDLQDAIVPINKYTNNEGKTRSQSSITATQDKLWLLSAVELGGSVRLGGYSLYDVYEHESSVWQMRYLLFDDAGVNFALKDSAYDVLKKSWQGSTESWWLRSPIPDSGDAFLAIGTKGKIVWGDPTTYAGVAPGFCI